MSNIEWTEKTWNPITGCDKVSEGCIHCYAETLANRFWGDRAFGDVQFHAERLQQPLKRKKPTMWFVNSMSDLFHESVSFECIAAIFGVMAVTPHHTYQVLTKRPQRMLEFFEWLQSTDADPWTECHFWALQNDDQAESLHQLDYKGNYPWPLSNLWLGVTVENQRTADERIPLLPQTPAAVRFLSCEPLLGEIDLTCIESEAGWVIDCLSGEADNDSFPSLQGAGHARKKFPAIDWVITGGESSAKARACDIVWIRSIVEQCREAGVSCFVKQLGHSPVITTWSEDDGKIIYPYNLSTGKGNNPDDWPDDLRVREMPAIKGDAPSTVS